MRILATAALLIGTTASAQTTSDSAAAVAVVEQFNAALAAGDSAKAVALLSDDLLVMEGGSIETRAEYLGGHLGADIKASRDKKEDRSVLRARVVGGLAYVVSRGVKPPTGVPGNTGSELAELMVLSRSPGRWTKIGRAHV